MFRARKRNYWLLKSEPDVFSINDLKTCGLTCWDGVRNYQARNFLRDEMAIGDGVLFYHSNAHPSGVAGLAEVARSGYPDDTAFDSKDVHFDPKSRPDCPIWYRVDIRFISLFPRFIPIQKLRQSPELQTLVLFRNGRLSVQPVSRREWDIILQMGTNR